jgi:hypothetical protein
MRLLLESHALTDRNATGRLQAHSDRPLSAAGRWQDARLAGRLAGKEIHEAYPSDLSRTWETADAIAGPRRLPVRSEPRFRELHFGVWEANPECLTAWEADALRIAPPGGETLAELAGRISAFFTGLTTKTAEALARANGAGRGPPWLTAACPMSGPWVAAPYPLAVPAGASLALGTGPPPTRGHAGSPQRYSSPAGGGPCRLRY